MLNRAICYFKKHPRILLSILVLLTAFVAYHPYIFGNHLFLFTDIGSDTSEQYIMQYGSIVNHIRNGNFSLWDFTNGFGTSMYQMNLFSPMLWLIYLPGILFGPQVMPGCLIYIHILTMLLASLAAWRFLSCFSFSDHIKLAAAYIYAFNGFLTVWGQHYQFSIIMIFLPLLLALIEQSLQKKRLSFAVPVCTALMVLCTYYLSYMVLLTAAFYIVFRLLMLQKQGVKHFLATVFKQGAFLLLGVGMGILNLLPSYALVYGVSSRMGTGQSLLERCIHAFAPYPFEYYQTLLHKLLSGNLQGVGFGTAPYLGYTNYYEAPNLFFSSLFLILLLQFLFALPKIQTSTRKKSILVLSILAGGFSLLIPFGSLVFNAFSYPFSRHTFLFMPFFALLTAYMLDYIWKQKQFSLTAGALAGFLMTAVYVTSARSALTRTLFCNALLLGMTALGMICLLFLLSRGKTAKFQSYVFLGLCLLIGLNVASDTYSTAAGRGTIQKTDAYFEALYGKDFQDLTAYLHETDSSFYRVEKDYSAGSHCMDSLGQYYRGISTYNSTENKYILEFANQLLPNLYYANQSHLCFQQVVSDRGYANLFGIKYLISKHPDLKLPNYQRIQQFGSLYLYENRDYTSFAKYYTQTVSASAYEAQKDSLDAETLLAQYLIFHDESYTTPISDPIQNCVYTPTDDVQVDTTALSTAGIVSEDGSLSWSESFMSVPLKRSNTASGKKLTVVFDLTLNGSFAVQVQTALDQTPYTVSITDGAPVSVSMVLPEDADTLYFTTDSSAYTTSVSNFRFFYSEPALYASDAELTMEDTGNDSRLVCNASVSEEGFLLLPIPYEQGWTAAIDQTPATLLRADYGFTAVKLTPGTHTVTLTYQQPLFKEALLITAICWALYAICAINRRQQQKKVQ